MALIALAPVNDFHRVLYEMYGWIFEELEREAKKEKINFYDLSYDKQWKRIKKKVDDKIAEREVLEPIKLNEETEEEE